MNAKDIKDIKDVRTVMEQMETTLSNQCESVNEIKIALMGDPKNRSDGGLFQDVRNNKRWKNNVNKALFTFGGISITTFIKMTWDYITSK